MTTSHVMILIVRYGLVSLFFPASALDKILNFKGAVNQWLQVFYPPGSDAASLWFQHLAVVVDDMPSAYGGLRGITPISQEGPQQLLSASEGLGRISAAAQRRGRHPHHLARPAGTANRRPGWPPAVDSNVREHRR
jgi:hypothetical protein